MMCEVICSLQHVSCDKEPGTELSKRNHSCWVSQASQDGLEERGGGGTTTSPAWDDSYCADGTNMLQAVNQSARLSALVRVTSSSDDQRYHFRGNMDFILSNDKSLCQGVGSLGNLLQQYTAFTFLNLAMVFTCAIVGYYITLITTLI